MRIESIKNGGQCGSGPSTARFRRFVLAEELFAVLDKTDEDDHGRPRQADKKHHFQHAHCKNRQGHEQIVACFQTGREPFP